MIIKLNNKGAITLLEDAKFVENASWATNTIDVHYDITELAEDSYCLISVIRADGITITNLIAMREYDEDGVSYFRYSINKGDGVLGCKGPLQISVQIIEDNRVLASACVSAHVFFNIGMQSIEDYNDFNRLLEEKCGIVSGKVNQNTAQVNALGVLVTEIQADINNSISKIQADVNIAKSDASIAINRVASVESQVKTDIENMQDWVLKRRLVDFTVDATTGLGVKYFDNDLTATVQFPVGGNGSSGSVNLFVREITFTEDSFVFVSHEDGYECAFPSAMTGFNSNKFITNIERKDGLGYVQTANELFKGSDGSMLLSFKFPFEGRVLLSGSLPSLKGEKGEKGDIGERGERGEGFSISKTYHSIDEMLETNDILTPGNFVIIASDVEDEDNAKLFVYTGEEYPNNFSFVTDMSGAKGIRGEKGDKGDAPRLTASATSVSYVAPAEVGITGDDGEYNIHFNIPRGTPGAPGEKGEPGSIESLPTNENGKLLYNDNGAVGYLDASAILGESFGGEATPLELNSESYVYVNKTSSGIDAINYVAQNTVFDEDGGLEKGITFAIGEEETSAMVGILPLSLMADAFGAEGIDNEELNGAGIFNMESLDCYYSSQAFSFDMGDGPINIPAGWSDNLVSEDGQLLTDYGVGIVPMFGVVQEIMHDGFSADTFNAIFSATLGSSMTIKEYVDSKVDVKADNSLIVYDVVIRTQDEFDALIASEDWLGASTVAFVGQFELSKVDNSGIKIPQTVLQIHGFNNAKITITNFNITEPNNKGFSYNARPTSSAYNVRDLIIECNGSNLAAAVANCINIYNCKAKVTVTGLSISAGFYKCDNIYSCIGISEHINDGNGSSTGFSLCTNLVNCSGKGTSITFAGRGFDMCTNLINCHGEGRSTDATGYAFCNITNASNCNNTYSETAMWGGINKNIDIDTCRKTAVTTDNAILNA